MKKCRVCGIVKDVTKFYTYKAFKGLSNRCKSCTSDYTRNYRHRFPEKRKIHNRTYVKKHKNEPKRMYVDAKSTAKRNGYIYELTFDAFMQYWQKSCGYCGDSIKTIGLDRINNNIGYTKENITPCCVTCNRMKLNYTVEKFINHCEKILQFQEEILNLWKLKNCKTN